MSEIRQNIQKSLIIAKYTSLDILKSKILINVALIGLGLVVVTFVAYQFTYGSPHKVAIDFGLGTLTLSSVGIALFFGSNLLSKEIENRTVHMIISRPVPRYVFIIGKTLGLNIILFINVLMLSILTLSVYFISGGEFDSLILWSLFFIFIESTIVLLVVSLFSLLTSQTLAVLISIALYIVGHAFGTLESNTVVMGNPFILGTVKFLNILLPAFYKLNLKDFVLYEKNVGLNYLFGATFYGFCYGTAIISLSIFIFNKKNLD